jgi:hypothetical protein
MTSKGVHFPNPAVRSILPETGASMRAIVVVGALVALSLVKVHTLRDDYGRVVSRVAIASPFSMPIDSGAAECMREWQAAIHTCLRSFIMRDRIKLFDLPASDFFSKAALALAISDMSPEASAARLRDIRISGLTASIEQRTI